MRDRSATRRRYRAPVNRSVSDYFTMYHIIKAVSQVNRLVSDYPHCEVVKEVSQVHIGIRRSDNVPLSRRNLELWKAQVIVGTPVASSTLILPFFIGKLRWGQRAFTAYISPPSRGVGREGESAVW